MSKKDELAAIREQKKQLRERKKAAFRQYDELRQETDLAYDCMKQAWQELTEAKDRQSSEFEARRLAFEHHDVVWRLCNEACDELDAEIGKLKQKADAEHKLVRKCFNKASAAYLRGARKKATAYSKEGRQHEARRDEFRAQIHELIDDVREIKAQTEALAPKVSSDAFNSAREDYERAKDRHSEIKERFCELKVLRDAAKAELDEARAEYDAVKIAFSRKLDEVRDEEAETMRAEVLERLNQAIAEHGGRYLGTFNGANVKIVPRKDETIHVYFGGLSVEGDGLGHGHAILDKYWNVIYLRDAWRDHGDSLVDFSKRRKGGAN